MERYPVYATLTVDQMYESARFVRAVERSNLVEEKGNDFNDIDKSDVEY